MTRPKVGNHRANSIWLALFLTVLFTITGWWWPWLPLLTYAVFAVLVVKWGRYVRPSSGGIISS